MAKKTVRTGILIALLVLFSHLYITSSSAVDKNAVQAKNGMVVSVDRYASQIGIDILKKGGNAVDAAVAVGFALAVTYPQAGNIGGGGFMVVRIPSTGEAVAIDFREKAPGRVSPDMYLNKHGEYFRLRSRIGHLAVGVPGTVKGFELAMQKFGKLSWQDVIAPAIELAEKGFALNEGMARTFNELQKVKRKARNSEITPKMVKEFFEIFSKPDGTKFVMGDVFVQKDLAASLRLISEHGAKAFYMGKIADLIAQDMAAHGGLITKDDLAKYEAFLREPVKGNYRGYEIISMPPPSSGGTILIEMLNILEGFDLGNMERYGPETFHLIAEVMKFAYLDRAKYLGDSDFGDIPVAKLTSKEHAKGIRAKIDLSKATPSIEIGKEILTLEESEETTHYSIVDKDGMAVATTYTLNGGFGAAVIPKETGIILNNEMGDFNMKPGYTNKHGLIGTEPNLIAPYKRMLSSMTPTIVVKDGKTIMITGSPGGRTIINTVLNVIINVIDFKMNIQEAVDAYRMDHEWMPDTLGIEIEAVTRRVKKTLRSKGHKLRLSKKQGDAHSIFIDPRTGIYFGAADRRSSGSAIGY
jgi:gamma-glutamyltranspeptidase/glutathione hydrolase